MNCDSPAANTAFTDVAYWNQRRCRPTVRVRRKTCLEPYLKNILPVNRNWSCLEIGTVPGNLLMSMAKHYGYRVTGIDFSANVNGLAEDFRRQSVDANFIQVDFFEWESDELFDVVFSAGFVEHFCNYEEVIQKHWDKVRPGGFLVVSVPAWSPVQRIIRKMVYTSKHFRKITNSHNLNMMNLVALRKAVDECRGGKTVLARYTQQMKVWVRPKHTGSRIWTAPLFVPIRIFELLFRICHISSSLFSPSVLVVRRKDAENIT